MDGVQLLFWFFIGGPFILFFVIMIIFMIWFAYMSSQANASLNKRSSFSPRMIRSSFTKL